MRTFGLRNSKKMPWTHATDEDRMIADAMRVALVTHGSEWTQTELAKALGVSRDKLSNILNARTKPVPEIVTQFQKILKLPDDWPGAPEGAPLLASSGAIRSLAGTPLSPLPVVGAAAAGNERFNVDPDLPPLYVPARLKEIADLGFKVEGDSMTDLLRDDDTAAFKRSPKPRSGYIYLFDVPDKGKRIKLLLYSRHDWYLCSLNPKYPPELLPPGTERLGLLVGYYRVDGKRETMDSDPDGLRADVDLLRNSVQ